MKPPRTLLTFVVTSSLALSGYVRTSAADTIEMKSGTVLLGEVLENKPESAEVVVHLGAKQVTLPRKEIAQITLDEAARAEFKKRVADAGKDAGSLLGVYEWAQQRRLYGLAGEALNAAAQFDPNHPSVKRALGEGEQTAEAKPAQAKDEPIFIGTIGKPEETRERTSFEKQVIEGAKLLGRSDAAEQEKSEVVASYVREKDKVGDVLLGALDYRKVTDEETRVGVVKGLQVVKPANPRVSPTLAWSAVMDPSASVRKGVVAMIKDRKDDAAVGGMIRSLIGAFDEEGRVINVAVRDNAVEGLRAMEDKRIGEALFTSAVMEVRATQTEGTLAPGSISSYTVLTGAQVTVLIPLTFPIEFPNLSIKRVRTTVSAPAASLRAYAGKDLGDDVNAWRAFLGK
ncbi:MAG: hypothetical protein KIS92_18570 [Planctomycetota bacterium]|nr:hypothetical protein [Planctomycetota bacterium]